MSVEVLEACADIGVSSTTAFLRRCFDNTTRFTIRNEGSEPASDVTLEITLDPFYEFLSADATVISQQDSILLLEVDKIAARGFQSISIQYKLSCEAELGRAHYVEAKVSSTNNCQTDISANETFECRENIGSYDPNDKQVYVDGFLGAEIISEGATLEYLIRFQNTGTDTAFTVGIEDVLNEAYDPNSIFPVASSHEMEN